MIIYHCQCPYKRLKNAYKTSIFYDLRVEIYDLRVMMHATYLLNLF